MVPSNPEWHYTGACVSVYVCVCVCVCLRVCVSVACFLISSIPRTSLSRLPLLLSISHIH